MREFELKYNLNYDFKLAKIQRIEIQQIDCPNHVRF